MGEKENGEFKVKKEIEDQSQENEIVQNIILEDLNEDPLLEVRKFLKRFHFPDKFIEEVIENGVTDEIKETLEAYKLSCEDIEFVCEKVKKKEPSLKHIDSCDCSFDSKTDVSSREPNFDTNYLKEHFGNILSAGLSEIAIKKPFDPIEYLGNWLLYYRECDEREKRRKEFEAELDEERLKYISSTTIAPSDDGEEEHKYQSLSTISTPCPIEP